MGMVGGPAARERGTNARRADRPARRTACMASPGEDKGAGPAAPVGLVAKVSLEDKRRKVAPGSSLGGDGWLGRTGRSCQVLPRDSRRCVGPWEQGALDVVAGRYVRDAPLDRRHNGGFPCSNPP